MIYLDNAATTKIDDAVLEAMIPYLNGNYGNAGGLYSLGREAKKTINESREAVASFLSVSPEQIIFTSGGSESNNMVFESTVNYLNDVQKRRILTSKIEHESVLKSVEKIKNNYGFEADYAEPDSCGRISVGEIERLIKDDTGIISVMYVNNETGVTNYIDDIANLCSKKRILFHTDCVQGGYCKPKLENCDFASFSSHKIHGPKGIGCLYVKDKSIIKAVIEGGSNQEFGLRGGTENVAAIVGFAKACSLAECEMKETLNTVSTLKQIFFNELERNLDSDYRDQVTVNGEIMSPGRIINITFNGIDGEAMVLMLDGFGICASAGSACNSHESTPSHVLTAMGLTQEKARNSVRFSFSKFNTIDEVTFAATRVALCVHILRKMKESTNEQ